MNTVSLKMIAEKAGVSEPTVSRILNNKAKVTKISHQRILDIARKLNYQPNQYARTLRTGRTGCIGISTFTGTANLFERFNQAYLGLTYTGIGKAISENDNKMIFDQVTEANDSLDLARKKMVDGIIFVVTAEAIGKFSEVRKRILPDLAIPYVVIHNTQEHMGIPLVGADWCGGGVSAVEHLIGHGYRSVGCVAGEAAKRPGSHAHSLVRGYREALAANGMEYDDSRMFHIDSWGLEYGAGVARKVLEQDAPPRALFCTDDAYARGMMLEFSRQGVRVPEDIALIGFSDAEPNYNEFCGLTSLKNPCREKGYEAGTLLFDLIKHPEKREEDHHVLLPSELVVRTSCGC